MRQWFEVPNSAITPTVIFHKLCGSGLKEKGQGCIWLLSPYFLLYCFYLMKELASSEQKNLHGIRSLSHFSQFLIPQPPKVGKVGLKS